MPGKRSFIDSRPKLFIALAQINMDTFYQHLFIIAQRRYPVTLYEQFVIELTVFFNVPIVYVGAKYVFRATRHYKKNDGTPIHLRN